MTEEEKKRALHRYRQSCEAIREVLIHEWDPIGGGDEPMVQGEYDSYIPVIYRLICEGADDEKLAAHLEHIEEHLIGLPSRKEHNLSIAARLREAIKNL